MCLVKTYTDFSQPEKYGLERVFNFYLDVEPNVRIGVWYVLQLNLKYFPLINFSLFPGIIVLHLFKINHIHLKKIIFKNIFFQHHHQYQYLSIFMAMLLIGKIFYNYLNRQKILCSNFLFSSLFNRRGMCEKLRKELKYDVFTFDYRGFGDSTGEPTEEGLIRDARYVYDWLHNASNSQRKIYIWGQSLGSAVACQLAARLSDDESMNFNAHSCFFPPINLLI